VIMIDGDTRVVLVWSQLGSGAVKTDNTDDIIITMDEFKRALSEVPSRSSNNHYCTR